MYSADPRCAELLPSQANARFRGFAPSSAAHLLMSSAVVVFAVPETLVRIHKKDGDL